MSSLEPNHRIDPEKIRNDGTYERYTLQYTDEYDNNWSLTLLGTPEEVKSIIGGRKFLINAIPQQETKAFERQMIEAGKLVGPSAEHRDKEDGGSGQFPGLQVHLKLESVIRPNQGHAIQIVFDPVISERPHRWEFDFAWPTHFSVVIETREGEVGWNLDSGSNGAVWYCVVWHIAGNPAEYEMITGGGYRI